MQHLTVQYAQLQLANGFVCMLQWMSHGWTCEAEAAQDAVNNEVVARSKGDTSGLVWIAHEEEQLQLTIVLIDAMPQQWPQVACRSQ